MTLIKVTEETVLVKTADLQQMVIELQGIRNDISDLKDKSKLDFLCEGGVVSSKAVRKLLGWSKYQLAARLKDELNPIPMTKDKRGYIMTRDQFQEYCDKNNLTFKI